MFNSKEKKLQKEREAEEAKANAEFEARMTAKQEKKNVERKIAEMDKTISNMLSRAADAKAKRYDDIYRQCISMIKIARTRKRQAEMFLFQIEAMQEMQTLAKSSSELLGSMGNVMNSLGKLSLDKTAMMSSQKDFAKVQQELDRQTMSLESFLSGMETQLSDDTFDIESDISDSSIEAEIDKLLDDRGGLSDLGSGAAERRSSGKTDETLDGLKQLLNS